MDPTPTPAPIPALVPVESLGPELCSRDSVRGESEGRVRPEDWVVDVECAVGVEEMLGVGVVSIVDVGCAVVLEEMVEKGVVSVDENWRVAVVELSVMESSWVLRVGGG